jgi:transposase-like protein
MSPAHQRSLLDPAAGPENSTVPENLSDAISYFSSPLQCVRFLSSRRWADGQVACPVCGSTNVRFLATRQLWECKAKHAGVQFSVKIGTVFEDSHIPLGLWLVSLWMLANSPRKISSYDLARELGITQKSAWFMLRRVAAALQIKGIELKSVAAFSKGTARHHVQKAG